MTDAQLFSYCRMLVRLRQKGASLRSIAKMIGYSKSSLHRWWPAIEEIALSQMGQQTDEKAGNAPVIGGELSHLGQATPNIEKLDLKYLVQDTAA